MRAIRCLDGVRHRENCRGTHRGTGPVDPSMEIEVWSDVICPWCYIGKRRLEAALASFEHRDQVQVRWRAFELDPSAPTSALETADQMLARKYGVGPAQVAQMQERVTSLAAGEGLHYRLDLARPTNSFDAHRLTALAASRGRQGEMVEALFSAYLTEGTNTADHDALRALGREVGLPPDEVDAVLTGGAFAEEVRGDEAEATELGATGVPFFVFDRRLAVAGAQDAAIFSQALEQSWNPLA